MNRRQWLGMAAGQTLALGQTARKPNVVVILSDDHGYGDVGYHDHAPNINTPNIDRISKRGVRFEQGYASCYVCAPTRASLLTGRYSQRYGFYTASDSRAGLPLTETTLADVLRGAGYSTGAFGKWHLGLTAQYHPLKRGFDEFYGFLGHGGHDYFELKRNKEDFQSIWRNNETIDETGYLTDNLGREAVGFVARHAAKPFFIYLAFNAVHFPLQAPDATIKKYDTGNPKRDTYLAMLEHEDRAIGRLLDELDKRNLTQNTLLFFLSDNGGARNNASSNGRLRDYKHSVYEGGIRVPFLFSWPARLPANTVSQEPVICMDILPTVCEAVGAPLPAKREIDGRSLLAVAAGKASKPLHSELYWDAGDEKIAVRAGKWKLVVTGQETALFDLEADSGEKNNLAAQQPAEVQRLRELFDRWRKPMPPRLTRGGKEEA